ncbi:unnamed protein product [Sphagnum balticum]
MDWVNQLAKVNNKFRFQLFGRNYENLEHIYASVQRFDPQSTGGMSEHAFNLFLNASGVFFTTQEIRSIRDQFPHSQGIEYFSFITALRQDITQKRLATIDHAFDQLSVDGKVAVATLLARLNPLRHPHVRSLTKSPEKVAAEMETAVRGRSQDGYLSSGDFRELFLDVSACVPFEREEFFIDLLINGFGLLEEGVSVDRLRQLEVTVFEKVRQRT